MGLEDKIGVAFWLVGVIALLILFVRLLDELPFWLWLTSAVISGGFALWCLA